MEMQFNAITGLEYHGRNQAELLAAKQKNNFTSSAWITFLQAKASGRKIKAGSHGVSIFKGFQKKEEKTEEGKIKTISYPVGFARVFNIDQTELVIVQEIQAV